VILSVDFALDRGGLHGKPFEESRLMNRITEAPRITLRIPGDWSHPKELLERLPEGVRLGPEFLKLPDGTMIEFNPLPPDDDFPRIFEMACRRPAADEELAAVERYQVNVALSGPGGSLDAAHAMMRAGAAIVQAGGAGVFIDNSALAHGAGDWLAMTDDGGADAISFAFVAIVRGERSIYTMGMHVMGYPDLAMSAIESDEHGEAMVELLRYVCRGDKQIGIGHILADEQGPRFRVVASDEDRFGDESPMHNPYGRLKIASMKEIAEGN
jgi:hypothetical protein